MIQSINHLSQAMYRQWPAVSQSDLKACFENPQLYDEIKRGKRPPRPSSDSQEWGTACESYIRTGQLGETEIPLDCLDRNGNRSGSSQTWKAFKAEHQGQLLLTPREVQQWQRDMDDVIRNVQQHELARSLLYSESAQWHQRFHFEGPHNLDMKCELDVFDQQQKRVVDLKTTADTDERSFTRDLMAYGYDIQAACYTLAAEMWEQGDWVYYWVVVKNTPPFNVEVYEASDDLLHVGLTRLLQRIEFFIECQKTKRWLTPTHGASIMVYPPAWAKGMVNV